MIPTHIDQLFHAFCLDDFLATTFERARWRGRLADPTVAARLWAGGIEVEDALLRSDVCLRREHVRIVREGRVLADGPLSAERDAPLREHDMAALALALGEGYTFAITLLSPRRGMLGALASLIEGTFGCASHVVVYVTPPRARGFDLHHDGDDVFVIQLAGEKRWLVGPPVECWPLQSGSHPSAERGDLATVPLAAGEVLYLPRGTVHAAETAEGPSVHVTFSLELPRVYERDLASCLAAMGPVAGQEIPAEAWDDPGEEDALAARLLADLSSRHVPLVCRAPVRPSERGWLERALGAKP